MKNFWRELKIMPSEQVYLIKLLQKYGSDTIREEIDYIIKKYEIPKEGKQESE